MMYVSILDLTYLKKMKMNNITKELIRSFFIFSKPEFNIYVKDIRSTDNDLSVSWDTWYGNKPSSPIASSYVVIVTPYVSINFRKNKDSVEVSVIVSIFEHDTGGKIRRRWDNFENTLTKYNYIEIEYYG